MNIAQPSGTDIQLVSTPQYGSSSDDDLLRIAYTRVQKDSPEFLTVHDGIDQNVDIKMSTLVFRAAPEPVLALYDFIMTTFVPNQDTRAKSGSATVGEDPLTQAQVAGNPGVIRVLVKLDGVQGVLRLYFSSSRRSHADPSDFHQRYDLTCHALVFNSRCFYSPMA